MCPFSILPNPSNFIECQNFIAFHRCVNAPSRKVLLLMNKWGDEFQRNVVIMSIWFHVHISIFLSTSLEILKCQKTFCCIRLHNGVCGHEIGWWIRILPNVSPVSFGWKRNWIDTLHSLTAPRPQMKDVWRNYLFCGITCSHWAKDIIVIEFELIFSYMHLEIAELETEAFILLSSLNKFQHYIQWEHLFTFSQIKTWIISISVNFD